MDSSFFEFGHIHCCKWGVIQVKTRTANRVDPDEMAHYKPFHQDLHCLQKYMFWSTEQKVTVMVTF